MDMKVCKSRRLPYLILHNVYVVNFFGFMIELKWVLLKLKKNFFLGAFVVKLLTIWRSLTEMVNRIKKGRQVLDILHFHIL